jgi:hypothetical protein
VPPSRRLDATGIYVCGYDQAEFIRKYTKNGRLLWQRRSTRGDGINRLVVDASGVYTIGDVSLDTDKRIRVLSKYTLGGSELWTRDLELPEYGSISALDGQIFVAGSFAPCSLCGRTSAIVESLSQQLPAQLQALNDTGRIRLAALLHDPHTSAVSAVVKDAATGGAVRRIEFDRHYWPQQLLRLSDSNGNGADEVALLGTHRTTGRVAAEVRDGRSGGLISRVPFDPGWVPRKLALLPDLNGNGTPDLALLQVKANIVDSRDAPFTRAEIRDGVTGVPIARIALGIPWHRSDLAIVPDRNGNGTPELAASGIDYLTCRTRLSRFAMPWPVRCWPRSRGMCT